MLSRIAGIFFIYTAFLSPAWAGSDFPSLGLVYHKTEASSLNHSCKLDGSELVCDFIQASVRRKLEPKDIGKRIEEARKQYRDNKTGVNEKECASVFELRSALKTGIPPKGAEKNKFAEGLASMSKSQMLDLTNLMDAGAKFCQDKSEENFLTFTKINIDKDVSTCSVSTYKFSQRFKHFPDSGTWVATQNGPEGICGIVNISRFQQETALAGSEFKFWKYIAKKVVTNKSGNGSLLMCSQLDENEYEYDWRSREIQQGCEYITFSPF